MWKNKIIQGIVALTLGVLVSPLKASDERIEEKRSIGTMKVQDATNSKKKMLLRIYEGETWNNLKSRVLEDYKIQISRLVYLGKEVNADAVIPPFDLFDAMVLYIPDHSM